jgi:amino acid transporter
VFTVSGDRNSYPISGGLVRWPQLAGGPFIGALTGWAAIAVIVVGGAVESSAIFQYVSHWWPAVFDSASGQLTWTGIGMCCAAIAVFTGLNLLAIGYVGALNMVLSVAKWVIPILTAALLLASGFHGTVLPVGSLDASSAPGAQRPV